MPSESELIEATQAPATVESLVAQLAALGVAAGDTLVVHSSMSALGWVAGGPQAVVEALFAAVGPDGTIAMPTQSGQLSDPAEWANPPVPAAWVEPLRTHLPAFDPYLTPTRMMGQVVECFRQHRETVRSGHPTVSFAANGRHAREIVADHRLSPGLGEGSPVATLYDLGANVLLLGVTHANNTSLHLAEHRASWPSKRHHRTGAPMLVDGARQWVAYDDLELDEDDFVELGHAFAATGAETSGPVGAGIGRLCLQSEIVDFAVEWISTNRH